MRRRLRVRPSASIAAAMAGPPALAVLRPRTHKRDIALFALQMWGFATAHEIPYDDPQALRRRLRIGYPVKADRLLGAGTLPSARLQRALRRRGHPSAVDKFLSMVHWSWFLEPYAALLWVLWRDEERFARAARQMAATYDIGCAVYFAVPTAPPWWASEQGYAREEVHRIMVEAGEEIWGERAWKVLYDSFGGNPWAAMPSLHFGSSLMAGLILGDSNRAAGAAGLTYAMVLGFALVYLGEHYVTDLLAGAAIVAAVRGGEPLVEPVVDRINAAIQRLERIANG